MLPPLHLSLSETISVKSFAVESVQKWAGLAVGDVIRLFLQRSWSGTVFFCCRQVRFMRKGERSWDSCGGERYPRFIATA